MYYILWHKVFNDPEVNALMQVQRQRFANSSNVVDNFADCIPISLWSKAAFYYHKISRWSCSNTITNYLEELLRTIEGNKKITKPFGVTTGVTANFERCSGTTILCRRRKNYPEFLEEFRQYAGFTTLTQIDNGACAGSFTDFKDYFS